MLFISKGLIEVAPEFYSYISAFFTLSIYREGSLNAGPPYPAGVAQLFQVNSWNGNEHTMHTSRFSYH